MVRNNKQAGAFVLGHIEGKAIKHKSENRPALVLW